MTTITLRAGTEELMFLGARPWPAPPRGVWEFGDLLGWRGLTDDRQRGEDLPFAHGAFEPIQSLRSQRAISFVARAACETTTDAEDFADELASLGAEAPVEMIVATDAGRTSRRVSVASITPQDRRNRSVVTMAVDLVAADPRRYAVSEDVPWEQTGPPSAGAGLAWPAVWPLVWPGGGEAGRITLENTGRAPSAPEFELLGGFGSAVITCVETGARIGMDRPTPVGSTVAIATDVDERIATLDGVSDVSRWLRFREWELVPKGESRTYQFDVVDPIASPLLRGRVRSAWW